MLRTASNRPGYNWSTQTQRRSARSAGETCSRASSGRNGTQAVDFPAAVHRLRTRVATARLAGPLTIGERRAVGELIVAIARLLDEAPG
jgi:hypothetical protein